MLPALAPTVPIVHGGVWPFSAQYLIGSQEFPGGVPLLRVSDLVQLPPLPGYLCNKKWKTGQSPVAISLVYSALALVSSSPPTWPHLKGPKFTLKGEMKSATVVQAPAAARPLLSELQYRWQGLWPYSTCKDTRWLRKLPA